MGISVQDKLSRAIYAMQNKLMDTNIQALGTKVSTVFLEIQEDKYGNEEKIIKNNFDIDIVLSFPDDEIPTSLGSTQNNTSSESTNVLHLADLLPIEGFVKTEDLRSAKIIVGSIILYKLKTSDGKFQVIPLQIVDCISKGNPSSGILWTQLFLSWEVDYALNEDEDYKEIVEEFKNKDLW